MYAIYKCLPNVNTTLSPAAALCIEKKKQQSQGTCGCNDNHDLYFMIIFGLLVAVAITLAVVHFLIETYCPIYNVENNQGAGTRLRPNVVNLSTPPADLISRLSPQRSSSPLHTPPPPYTVKASTPPPPPYTVKAS